MDPRQQEAITNIVAALFFSFSYILLGALYFPFTMPIVTTIAERMVFTWQCCLFAALPLATGIIAILTRKILRPSTLDGEPVLDGSRLDIHIRFVRDTSIQLLLFVIALFNMAIFLQGTFVSFLPVITSWFIFARIFYWIAYLFSPGQRIFGSVATLAPILFMLGWCTIQIFSKAPITY
jgi:hypothetical protein